MDILTKYIHGDVSCCMLFIDDIILKDSMQLRKELTLNQKFGKEHFSQKGFEISRKKVNVWNVTLATVEVENNGEVKIENQEIINIEYFLLPRFDY